LFLVEVAKCSLLALGGRHDTARLHQAPWHGSSVADRGGERLRRIGVLYSLAENEAESVTRRAAFEQAIKELGWTSGGNLRIDYRWA
jgi:hypothetical protein